MCRNVRSIEWHQKTYHEISWDYPFKPMNEGPIGGIVWGQTRVSKIAWHLPFMIPCKMYGKFWQFSLKFDLKGVVMDPVVSAVLTVSTRGGEGGRNTDAPISTVISKPPRSRPWKPVFDGKALGNQLQTIEAAPPPLPTPPDQVFLSLSYYMETVFLVTSMSSLQ
jgi:hypothetical protein